MIGVKDGFLLIFPGFSPRVPLRSARPAVQSLILP